LGSKGANGLETQTVCLPGGTRGGGVKKKDLSGSSMEQRNARRLSFAGKMGSVVGLRLGSLKRGEKSLLKGGGVPPQKVPAGSFEVEAGRKTTLLAMEDGAEGQRARAASQ